MEQMLNLLDVNKFLVNNALVLLAALRQRQRTSTDAASRRKRAARK